MSNKFLTTTEASDLSKQLVFAGSLGATNLDPSRTLKTDSSRRLVSASLAVSDVQGLQQRLDQTIVSPFDGTLRASNFETPATNVNALAVGYSNLLQTSLETASSVRHITADETTTTIASNVQTGGVVSCSNVVLNGLGLTQTLNAIISNGGIPVIALEEKTQNITASVGLTTITGSIEVAPSAENVQPLVTSGAFNANNIPGVDLVNGIQFTLSDRVMVTRVGIQVVHWSVPSANRDFKFWREGVVDTPLATFSVPRTSIADGAYVLDVELILMPGTYRLGIDIPAGQARDVTSPSGGFVFDTRVNDVKYVTSSSSMLGVYPENTQTDNFITTGVMYVGSVVGSVIEATTLKGVQSINGLTTVGGKYVQTGLDVVIGNTNTPSSCISSGRGALLFPAATFVEGDTCRCTMTGRINDKDSNQELKIDLYLGALLHTTTFIDLDAIQGGPLDFELDVTFTCKTIGPAANFSAASTFLYRKGGADLRGWCASLDTVQNTRQDNTLQIVATWNNAFIENILTIKNICITKIY